MKTIIKCVTKSLPLDTTIRKIIQKVKMNKDVIAVGIFGSYARGEKYNDIDICIFLKIQKYEQLQLSRLRLSFMHSSEKYDVQVFQQLPMYIKKRILKEAKIIYCKDEDALYDLYFLTLKQFNDYKYHYEQYLESVLND